MKAQTVDVKESTAGFLCCTISARVARSFWPRGTCSARRRSPLETEGMAGVGHRARGRRGRRRPGGHDGGPGNGLRLAGNPLAAGGSAPTWSPPRTVACWLATRAGCVGGGCGLVGWGGGGGWWGSGWAAGGRSVLGWVLGRWAVGWGGGRWLGGWGAGGDELLIAESMYRQVVFATLPISDSPEPGSALAT